MVSYMYVSKENPYIVAKTQFLTHVGRKRGIMLFPLRLDNIFEAGPISMLKFHKTCLYCALWDSFMDFFT